MVREDGVGNCPGKRGRRDDGGEQITQGPWLLY